MTIYKPMKVVEEKRENHSIFHIEGRLDSSSSSELDQLIMQSIASGQKNILLEFSEVNYLSSAGIRVLVHCHKELQKQSGHILLVSVPKPIENVLYLTGFLPYFKVFEGEAQAAASLGH